MGLPPRSTHPRAAADGEHGLNCGIWPVTGQVEPFLLFLLFPLDAPRAGVSATPAFSEWEVQRLQHPSRKG